MMGESLGGGVAVDLAAADGARGLILENTFSSLPDVAARHFPWLPVHLLMRTRLNSAEKIPNYHGPLLQVHGDRDQIIPFAIGKKLFDAANEPKQFVVVPGGDHNDPSTPAYLKALDEFIGKLPYARSRDNANRLDRREVVLVLFSSFEDDFEIRILTLSTGLPVAPEAPNPHPGDAV